MTDIVDRLQLEINRAGDEWAYARLMKEGVAEITRLRSELEQAKGQVEKLQNALIEIADRDWTWKGSGTDVRYRLGNGRIAAKALGIPERLPEGRPDPSGSESRSLLVPSTERP